MQADWERLMLNSPISLTFLPAFAFFQTNKHFVDILIVLDYVNSFDRLERWYFSVLNFECLVLRQMFGGSRSRWPKDRRAMCATDI